MGFVSACGSPTSPSRSPDSPPITALSLDGRPDSAAREWLGGLAGQRGLDPGALDAPLPYTLPAHAVASGAAYWPSANAQQLGELAAWFSNANAALNGLRQQLVARGRDVPPVRCWPHHFDLDMLVTVAPGRTTGIGFEPGDEHYDEPYFYVSIHPAPEAAALPKLPIGHWHTKNFTAAIATAQRIVAAKDPGGDVMAFLRAATDATIAALQRK
jgi:hypothetical protein